MAGKFDVALAKLAARQAFARGTPVERRCWCALVICRQVVGQIRVATLKNDVPAAFKTASQQAVALNMFNHQGALLADPFTWKTIKRAQLAKVSTVRDLVRLAFDHLE